MSSQNPEPSFKLRNVIAPVLKILLATGLLYYVVSKGKIDFKQVGLLFDVPALLVLVLAGSSVQILIGAQRMRMLLRPPGVDLTYLSAVRLTYLGAFFDVFGVTSVGGDAVKAIYLARQTARGKRTAAVSVLVLDRLFGLIGLLTLALMVSVWQLSALRHDPASIGFIQTLAVISLALMIGTAMLFSEGVHQSRSMQLFLRIIPLGAHIDRAYLSLQRFKNHPHVLVKAWWMSLAVHTLGIGAGYLLVLGMQQHPDFGRFAVAWLLANFAASFLPFGGIGGGQIAYEHLFATIASMNGGANLATAVQAVWIIAKSPGLIAWLMSRETPENTGEEVVQEAEKNHDR